MKRLRMLLTTRRARWTIVLVVAVAVCSGLTVWSSTPAQAGPLRAEKNCAPNPEPIRPDAGIPGMIYDQPSTAVDGDPFAEGSTVTIADVYGYGGYRWVNYDNGCLPGGKQTVGIVTGIANSAFAGAASVVALTHKELDFVIDPEWLHGSLDKALERTTAAVKDGFFGPWFAPMLILVAASVLWAARKADLSGATTTAGWALLVLVVTTYVMSYPVASAEAVDELVQASVTTAAKGTIGGQQDDPLTTEECVRQPPTYTECAPGTATASGALRGLNAQMDTINRNTLYAAWLDGVLGSSTSPVAVRHGADLWRASHLSWAEAQVVDDDPAAGKILIDAKKAAWQSTAAAVKEADPDAYQQLTGNKGRFDAMGSAWYGVIWTMPFLVVAGFLIVVSYLAIRILIPVLPALGVFGMFRPLDGWMMSAAGRTASIVIAGPVFFGAALVNLLYVNAIFHATGIPYAMRYMLAAVMPVLLFAILKPKRGQWAARRLMRQARRVTRMTADAAKPDRTRTQADRTNPATGPDRRSGPVYQPRTTGTGEPDRNTPQRPAAPVSGRPRRRPTRAGRTRRTDEPDDAGQSRSTDSPAAQPVPPRATSRRQTGHSRRTVNAGPTWHAPDQCDGTDPDCRYGHAPHRSLRPVAPSPSPTK